MGDHIIRHMVALAATLVTVMAYYAGYISGIRGWWWTVFAVAIIYGGVYRLVDK
ncbi:MAG: hypothetical protein Q7S24_01125 [bacterium]|nr:hypothetical protein [bacterium]